MLAVPGKLFLEDAARGIMPTIRADDRDAKPITPNTERMVVDVISESVTALLTRTQHFFRYHKLL